MSFWSITILIIQMISALLMVIFILLQQGKGAITNSTFGSGSSNSFFGSSGSSNFLSRITKWSAIVFFSTTASLSWINYKKDDSKSLMIDYQSEIRKSNILEKKQNNINSYSIPSIENKKDPS